MNIIAKELNNQLEGTIASRLFSDLGKRLFFPKGIAAQSAEAKERAHRFNATIGMAYDEGDPMVLPSIRRHVPHLGPVEAVAYAPTGGDNRLRKKWQELILKKNSPVKEDGISMPTVVPGLTNGINQVADLFADKGDTIIIPDMFWGNYRLIFEVRKECKIENYPFFAEGKRFNIEGLIETVRKKPVSEKIQILLNFPNNPTGYSLSKEEAEKLQKEILALAEDGYQMLILVDDAYFGLFYEEGSYNHSLFSLFAALHENILAAKVDGATKEDFVWGFRVGFVTFGSKGMNKDHYTALNKKLTGSIRSTVSNSSRVGQSLLLRALVSQTYDDEKEQNFKILKSRYHAVKKILAERTTGKSLEELPFNSGYFMTFRCKGDAEQLRQALLDQGIGTISIGTEYLRVAFSSVDEQNLEKLYQAIFSTADQLS